MLQNIRIIFFLAIYTSLIATELHAQSATREGEQYEILNLVIRKHGVKDLYVGVANGNLITYTDTLHRFHGWQLDSEIVITKVQQQDFIDQLMRSKIRFWDPQKTEANPEKENISQVVSAALANNWELPDKYSKFQNKKADVYQASIPVFTIDRQTAYMSLSDFTAEFKNNKLESWGDGKAGIYVLQKKDGKWSIENYIIVMGGH